MERGETSLQSYENSAWPFKQAHTNGTKKAYREIMDLLSFLD